MAPEPLASEVWPCGSGKPTLSGYAGKREGDRRVDLVVRRTTSLDVTRRCLHDAPDVRRDAIGVLDTEVAQG